MRLYKSISLPLVCGNQWCEQWSNLCVTGLLVYAAGMRVGPGADRCHWLVIDSYTSTKHTHMYAVSCMLYSKRRQFLSLIVVPWELYITAISLAHTGPQIISPYSSCVHSPTHRQQCCQTTIQGAIATQIITAPILLCHSSVIHTQTFRKKTCFV